MDFSSFNIAISVDCNSCADYVLYGYIDHFVVVYNELNRKEKKRALNILLYNYQCYEEILEIANRADIPAKYVEKAQAGLIMNKLAQ